MLHRPLPSILLLIATLAALSSCSHLFNDAKLTGGLTYDPTTKTFGLQVGKEPIVKVP